MSNIISGLEFEIQIARGTSVGNTFSTELSEHKGHLYEVGLLDRRVGTRQWWKVEIRLLDGNGTAIEGGTVVLGGEFADESLARATGAVRAHRLIEEQLNLAA
jgi:hypothetical protein